MFLSLKRKSDGAEILVSDDQITVIAPNPQPSGGTYIFLNGNGDDDPLWVEEGFDNVKAKIAFGQVIR